MLQKYKESSRSLVRKRFYENCFYTGDESEFLAATGLCMGIYSDAQIARKATSRYHHHGIAINIGELFWH
jgi:hypothetical protein